MSHVSCQAYHENKKKFTELSPDTRPNRQFCSKKHDIAWGAVSYLPGGGPVIWRPWWHGIRHTPVCRGNFEGTKSAFGSVPPDFWFVSYKRSCVSVNIYTTSRHHGIHAPAVKFGFSILCSFPHSCQLFEFFRCFYGKNR